MKHQEYKYHVTAPDRRNSVDHTLDTHTHLIITRTLVMDIEIMS